MSTNTIKLAAALLLASVGMASANVTMVDCEGVIISIPDDVAAMGQEKMGTMVEFTNQVCAQAEKLPIDSYNGPTRVSVTTALGIETVIVVFPVSNDN